MAYIDILPTLMAAAGVGETGGKPLDGLNMLPVLQGNSRGVKRELYFFYGETTSAEEQIAVIDSPWKLCVLGPDVSTGMTAKHQVKLFDIIADPSEKENVAGEHPEKVKNLEERLKQFRKLQPPNPVPYRNVGKEGFTPPKNWRILEP